ncbi:MAG: beta-ketoacyl synthase N-terminal-like domain-containing protein, partial [Opitutaceae bacterium]
MESSPPRRRVVVTGAGVVSSLGLDLASFWDGLISGRSGIRAITV